MNKTLPVGSTVDQIYFGHVIEAARGRALSVAVGDQVFQVSGQARCCGRIEQEDEVAFHLRDGYAHIAHVTLQPWDPIQAHAYYIDDETIALRKGAAVFILRDDYAEINTGKGTIMIDNKGCVHMNPSQPTRYQQKITQLQKEVHHDGVF